MALLRPDWRPDDRVQMAEKQARVNQLQSIFMIYEQIHANLLVLERPFQYSNTEVSPRMQQLQSTVDLYQEVYLTLVEDLEQIRLARLQRTPNIVQIEEATIPEKPVRPIPLLYTALSGVVGLMLAVLLILFLEALKDNQETHALVPHTGDQWQLEPPDVPETEKLDKDTQPKRLESGKKKINPTRKALLEKKK